MPPVSVLIKPASGRCNLRCTYCFYHAITENRCVSDFGLMSLDTLETIVKKVLEFADGFATFSFQGGEPTLCGLNFYKELLQFQQKYNTKKIHIKNCLQTNGILIDEEWAEFLRENNFLVGLSLDGPETAHNEFRKNAVGEGTYNAVINTANLLKKHNVEFNILFVVNSINSKAPEKLYNYFLDNSFNFLQFIPCIDPEGYERGTHPFSLSNEKFAHFLKGFFDKWYADISREKEVSIRYFDNLVRIAMGMQPETCSMLGSCRCQFVFEADGSVYPCDFYVTDEWKMGSIYDMSLFDLSRTDTAMRFIRSSFAVPDKCKQCKWYSLCRGGCRRDCQNNLTGELGVNTYCDAYIEFYKYAFDRIQKLAKYFSKR